MLSPVRPLLLATATWILFAPPQAWAVDPYEVQVYEGDINDPRQPGVELHANTSARTLRLTLEPSFGVLEWWELGAYLQSATTFGPTDPEFAGFKLRSKFV